LARLAFAVLTLFWGAAGWFFLIQGGFHKTYRFSKETTFVDGPGAIAVAATFLLLACISAAVVLQSLHARRGVYGVVILAILLPPCLFLLNI